MTAKRRSTTSRSGRKKKSGILKKVFIAFILMIALSSGGAFIYFYGKVFKPNMHLKDGKTDYVYIRTTDTFTDVVNQLTDRNMLKDQHSFVWLSELMKYDQAVKPGKYLVTSGMNNKDLIVLLRSGKQEPVKIVLHSIRSKYDLAGKVGKLIEADSLGIIQLLNNNSFMAKYGLNSNTAIALFLPDTYEFYWSTTPEKFIERMYSYHEKFWDELRLSKAQELNLTKGEVCTLASIVQMETNKNDEKPTVAGVYLNRLRIGMALQADPTVVFAIGDFEMKRVSTADTKFPSPYNTYLHKGLPPGPIYLPTKQSIDAVLNFGKHNYLYFCAKDDFSGYHTFTNDYNQHLTNARKYHKALNKRKIKR
jgi:UPF0755 protein